jgi:hypothetical protein
VEFQNDVVREGGIEVLVKSGLSDDARVQRDTASAFSALTLPEHLKRHIVDKDSLPTLFALARSLDVASQRYATLSICNLSAGDLKAQIVDQGAIRPLMFLCRFPDLEIQRYAALAVAALALGGHGNNKTRIIEEGAAKPLIELGAFSSDVGLRLFCLCPSRLVVCTCVFRRSEVS